MQKQPDPYIVIPAILAISLAIVLLAFLVNGVIVDWPKFFEQVNKLGEGIAVLIVGVPVAFVGLSTYMQSVNDRREDNEKEEIEIERRRENFRVYIAGHLRVFDTYLSFNLRQLKHSSASHLDRIDGDIEDEDVANKTDKTGVDNIARAVALSAIEEVPTICHEPWQEIIELREAEVVAIIELQRACRDLRNITAIIESTREEKPKIKTVRARIKSIISRLTRLRTATRAVVALLDDRGEVRRLL